MVPPCNLSQIIAGASYQVMACRNRMLEAYGIDVLTKEVRDRHSNAVLEVRSGANPERAQFIRLFENAHPRRILLASRCPKS